jgi:molecular chaperone GrpE
MAETHHDRTRVPPREPGGATGDMKQEGEGDAQIRTSPPNVVQTERPAQEILEDAEDDGENGAVGDDDVNALYDEIDRLQGELGTATDRYLRIAAEFDNYRRRVERERSEMPQRAKAAIVSPLLDVLDDLDRVAAQDEGTPSAALLQGIQLVGRKFGRLIEGLGLDAVDPTGEAFDPNTMEAVATVPAGSRAEDNVVSDVFQKGYRLGDTLVRPARVRVKQFDG